MKKKNKNLNKLREEFKKQLPSLGIEQEQQSISTAIIYKNYAINRRAVGLDINVKNK